MTLQTHTVSRLLHQTLMELMRSPNLKDFHLADTTSLSLQFGHRHSNEIDLYTGMPFSEAELQKVKNYVLNTFGKGEQHTFQRKGNGTSIFLYNLNKDYVKIDLYYDAPFLDEPTTVETFRFASPRDTMARTLEHIRKGGSKADFWNLHYLINTHSMEAILDAHRDRYPEQHQKNELKKKLTDFSQADDDFDPPCLMKKNWNLMKLDILEAAKF